MPTCIDNIVNRLAKKSRSIFLIDGLGATITVLLLLLLVAGCHSFFGMPILVVYILAGMATIFMAYSLGCFFTNQSITRFLPLIIIANTVYCTATAVLLVYYHQYLSWAGFAYFIGEILVILALVYIEIQLWHKEKHTKKI